MATVIVVELHAILGEYESADKIVRGLARLVEFFMDACKALRERKTARSCQTGAPRPTMRDFSREGANLEKIGEKRKKSTRRFFGRRHREEQITRRIFASVTSRRVFLDTFRTKHSSSFKESSKEMFPAQNSSTLLARRAV
jgi:hypothetical protein